MTTEAMPGGEVTPAPLSIDNHIESLPFVKVRLRYLEPGANLTGTQAERAADPTTEIITRWQAHKTAIHAARLHTMQCCEARPGRGDAAALYVVDRETFDGLQLEIKDHAAAIEGLEAAIRRLDETTPRFICDMVSEINGARSNHQQVQRVYNSWFAEHIRLHPGKTIEEIGQIKDVKRRAELVAAAEAAAEKVSSELEPKIKAVREILEGVGCRSTC